MCEAILSLYNSNSWTQIHEKRAKTNLHWILQAIGSSMAIAGMVIEFINRDIHFRTRHSKIGKIFFSSSYIIELNLRKANDHRLYFA